jgi:hypothetical protein
MFDEHSVNFFILLLLGGALLYGLMPAYGAAILLLAFLWLLGMHPIVAIALAIAWCLRDFFIAFIAGLGGGLGLRASGWSRDRSPRRSMRDRWRGRP